MCVGSFILLISQICVKDKVDAFEFIFASSLICGDEICSIHNSFLAFGGVQPSICMKFFAIEKNFMHIGGCTPSKVRKEMVKFHIYKPIQKKQRIKRISFSSIKNLPNEKYQAYVTHINSILTSYVKWYNHSHMNMYKTDIFLSN